jgi:hypothetical protein
MKNPHFLNLPFITLLCDNCICDNHDKRDKHIRHNYHDKHDKYIF